MLAKVLNCISTDNQVKDTLKCIKGKSVEELLKAQQSLQAIGGLPKPILGDQLLPFHSFETELNNGRFNKDIDFMYGTMLNEG